MLQAPSVVPTVTGGAAEDAERRRLANVRPADWQNPSPAERYHLVVIGAGTAGLVSAAVAAGLGARVALVERHLMGGDCLNVGCVPSKGIIRAARAWHSAQTAAERFGGPAACGPGDFVAAMTRMRELRAGLSRLDSAARFRDLGVDVFLGEGRFTSRDVVTVRDANAGEAALRFRRAIVATGGRAATPAIDGLEAAGYLTNETVFDIDALPARLLVVGGGPIGCELAQAFARFGSTVTILNADAQLLPRDDPDAARAVERALAADGVAVHHGAKVTVARRDGDERTLVYETEGRRAEVTGDAILVAAGRAPNVEGLGLEVAGVRVDRRGIDVDARFRTSNRRVYAIGDCASRYQFTHAADAQARLAVPNALLLGLGGGKGSDLVIPWCTYTSPEVAHVGISAREAADAGDAVETITVPLADVDRAVLDGDPGGFFRVHLARRSDRILGATFVADHAGETITEVTAAMVNGVGLGGLGKAMHPYPTHAESIRKAADVHRRARLTPAAKRLLTLFFRTVR
jgi:pyruvate/2-oxoglutarate dehydrogenase complex dihydrolipoamide dehydrogenase (E3) component